MSGPTKTGTSEIAAAEEGENVQQQHEEEKDGKHYKDDDNNNGGHKRLDFAAFNSPGIGRGEPEKFYVQLQQGHSGTKFLQISKQLTNGKYQNFSKILVPDDAYPFVRAMDELLRELGTKEDLKLPSTESRSLFSTSSPGKAYDFKMDLKWENDRFAVKLGTCRTEAKPEHKETRAFMLDVKQFHWLRHEMGEMLARHDGSQPVDEPSKFPEWLLSDGRPRRPVQQQFPQLQPVQTPNQNDQQLPTEQFGKRFNTGNMANSKNAVEHGGEQVLARKHLRSLDVAGAPEHLSIALQQGRSEAKFMNIAKKTEAVPGCFINFPNILVPEDVYQFVRALDELLGKLGTKEGLDMDVSSASTMSGCHLVFSTGSPGKFYDYQLDLGLDNGRFSVDLNTCKNEARPNHEEKTLPLSMKELFWLRHRIGEMLAEFDGSQPVDEPPEFPGHWLLLDGRPRSSPAATLEHVQHQQMPTELEQPTEQSKQMPDEHIGEQFSNNDMDKNAVARVQNIVAAQHKTLDQMHLHSLDFRGEHETLSIELAQGRSGAKYMKFRKEFGQEQEQISGYKKIMMPQEVYHFARAMDLLLGKLAMEEGGGQQLPSTGSRLLFSTNSPGKLYDFQLDLKLVNGTFAVILRTRRTEAMPEHREMRAFWLSPKQFHWFRQSMGKMLAKFDGSQQLDAPPELPEWLQMSDVLPIPRSGQYPNPVPMPQDPAQYQQENNKYESRMPPYNSSNMASLAQKEQQGQRKWPGQAETEDNFRKQHQSMAMTWDFGGGGRGGGRGSSKCQGGQAQDGLDIDTVQGGDEK